MLDAWAIVTHVLTFYQERIANEGFLRTSTERRSVLELARAIGYELNPSVAPAPFWRLQSKRPPGAPGRATVDMGTKVLSIPGQNEKPQTFETIEKIEVRTAWNTLQPRLTEPQKISKGLKELYLQGVSTQLQPGDAILVVGDDRDRFPGSGTLGHSGGADGQDLSLRRSRKELHAHHLGDRTGP